MQIGEPTCKLPGAEPPALELEVQMTLWGLPILGSQYKIEFSDGATERHASETPARTDCTKRSVVRVTLGSK